MSNERKYGSFSGSPRSLSCSEFDALLADAVDGTLTTEQINAFDGHAQACDDCGALLEETRRGLAALKTLEEVEPPSTLVHNILARTSHAEEIAGEKVTQTPSRPRWALSGLFAGMRHPRLVTTFAMAFFSLSLMFSAMGLRFDDLSHMDLRPSTIHRTVSHEYFATSARFVRFYKNTRLVYEFEARLHEWRNATQGGEQPTKTNKPNSNTSQHQIESGDDIAHGVKDHSPRSSAELYPSNLPSANEYVSFPRRLA